MGRVEGANFLRSARRLERLTQEQLAAAAGVHVRTVRNLESASSGIPHRSTLQRLASALILPSAERTAFLDHWMVVADETLTPDGMFGGRDARLEEYARLALATQTMLSLSEIVQIGADRQLLWWQTEEVIQARVDGVDRRTVFYEPEDPAVDLHQLQMGHFQNCSPLGSEVFAPAGYKVFHLGLGRSLRRGESYVIRYRADFGSSYRGDVCPRATGEVVGGFFRPPKSYLLEVRFSPEAIPGAMGHLFRSSPASTTRRTRNLQLGGGHSVHIALTEPRAGAHGIHWTW